MFKTLSSRLVVTAAFALAGTGAMAAPVAIDTTNASNGIFDIYSATFDGALVPCGGGSPSYCSFFTGDPPAPRAIVLATNPTGVTTGIPAAIAPVPLAGSYLDLTLSGGNTMLTIAGGTITLPTLTLVISGTTFITASGAGFVFEATPVSTAVNGSGQAEFLIDPAGVTLGADFSTLSSVVTSCTGPLCALVGLLSLDMLRYRLFVDYDPTFTSFTADFIGQTANNSLVFANLDSAVVPVPAAVWLLGSALAALVGLRRRAIAK